MKALALVVVAVGCAERPLPLPEGRADEGAAADLAPAELSSPECRFTGDLCFPLGACCSQNSDCCNLRCCPQPGSATGICGMQCGPVCVPRDGPCTTTADCCTGLDCIIPNGALAGSCGTPPQPDLAGNSASSALRNALTFYRDLTPSTRKETPRT
jgi:hypothetical protein